MERDVNQGVPEACGKGRDMIATLIRGTRNR